MIKLRYLFLFLTFSAIKSSEVYVEHITDIHQATDIQFYVSEYFTIYSGVLPNKAFVKAELCNVKASYSCKAESYTNGRKAEISKHAKEDFETLQNLLSNKKFKCKK